MRHKVFPILGEASSPSNEKVRNSQAIYITKVKRKRNFEKPKTKFESRKSLY